MPCPRVGASSSPTTSPRADVTGSTPVVPAAPAPTAVSTRAAPTAPAAPVARRRRHPAPTARHPSCSTAKPRGPLRGASARIVENMEASLGVPDGHVGAHAARQAAGDQSSDPEQPARPRSRRQGQLHAPDRFRSGARLAERAPHERELRRRRRHAERRASTSTSTSVWRSTSRSRTAAARCSCRIVKEADTLDFAGFHAAYEDLIRRARTNKLTLDDFAGTTVSLTNPGTIGTLHSVPRLMPGQGVIVGVGAITYPPEYEGADPQTLAEIGISKTVTLTSTYDHRIIQGAESGEFLAKIHDLLLGGDSFYDEIFASFGVPYEPARWSADHSPIEGTIEAQQKVIAVQQLINMYRVARSPHREPRSVGAEGTAHARRARPEPLGPHDLGPRPRIPDRWSRGPRGHEAARHPGRAARRVPRAPSASSTCTSRSPTRRPGSSRRSKAYTATRRSTTSAASSPR